MRPRPTCNLVSAPRRCRPADFAYKGALAGLHPQPDEAATAIAGHIPEYLKHEVAVGRIPQSMLPIQSGVGNIANAVLTGLVDMPFNDLTAYTEGIRDGCSTSWMLASWALPRGRLFPSVPKRWPGSCELVRRLGCVSMNGMIEADIYGTINSTCVMGSRIQNGIGGPAISLGMPISPSS